MSSVETNGFCRMSLLVSLSPSNTGVVGSDEKPVSHLFVCFKRVHSQRKRKEKKNYSDTTSYQEPRPHLQVGSDTRFSRQQESPESPLVRHHGNVNHSRTRVLLLGCNAHKSFILDNHNRNRVVHQRPWSRRGRCPHHVLTQRQGQLGARWRIRSRGDGGRAGLCHL